MMRNEARVFPEELRVKAPQGARDAIAAAALRRHTTRSEYVRQAVIRSLEADGIHLRVGEIEGSLGEICVIPGPTNLRGQVG